MPATIVNWCEAVKTIVQTAITANYFGAGLTFDLKRVPVIEVQNINENDEKIHVHIGRLGEKGNKSGSAGHVERDLCVGISVSRKLTKTTLTDTAILAADDAFQIILEKFEDLLQDEANNNPGSLGPTFDFVTYWDAEFNQRGLQGGLKELDERRQLEALLYVHYRSFRSVA